MSLNKDNKRTEYSVYTIHKAQGSNDNHPKWERKHTTMDCRKAIARAKVLHRSNDYCRVEVKKKVCDENNVCVVTEGYKIFDTKSQRQQERSILLLAFYAGAVALAGLVFYTMF